MDSTLRLWDLRKLGGGARAGGAGCGVSGRLGASAALAATMDPTAPSLIDAHDDASSAEKLPISMEPIWTKSASSPAGSLHPGDPVLSLQLAEDRMLTSHGGKQWTARVWDLSTL